MKKGFTIAEILVVLAIVGVVAAITIPGIILKNARMRDFAKLQKAENTIKQVAKEAERKYGPMQNWDWSMAAEYTFNRYFREHFDTQRNCNDPKSICLGNDYRYKNGTKYEIEGSSDLNINKKGRVQTPDGISYRYVRLLGSGPGGTNAFPNSQGFFLVDINGANPPNVWGRDVYSFRVYGYKLGVVPEGAYSGTKTITLPNGAQDTVHIPVSTESAKTACRYSGQFCTAYYLSRGQIDL